MERLETGGSISVIEETKSMFSKTLPPDAQSSILSYQGARFCRLWRRLLTAAVIMLVDARRKVMSGRKRI